MGLVVYMVGALFLLHAGYSSFEFHQLLKTTHHLTLSSTLPLDIVAEVLLGILIVVYGAVSSISNTEFLSIKNELIKPQYTYLKPIDMKHATTEFEQLQINPFEELESRVEFLDVLKKREEYREYVASK